MNDEMEICTCTGVTRGEIIKAIKEKGLQTVEEVQEATEAGTVCGSCIPDIEDILKEVNG